MSNIVHSLELTRHDASERGVSVTALIQAWLHSKDQRSHSSQTRKAYEDTITKFREFLQEHGYDLIWKGDDFIPVIADFAQSFAATRSKRSKHKGDISPATQSQRLAILSSFYHYAIQRRHILTANPIDSVERPSVESYTGAHAIEQEEVEARLRSINKTTLQGVRDLALLSVLLSTGRRASEVASLRGEHIQESGKIIKLSFEHCKGAKKMRDALSIPVSKALRDWLTMFYQCPIEKYPPAAPLWVNVHHQSQRGEALGYHGVSGVCKHYLGTTKVHVTRHTFAILMEMAGAKLTDIQQRLGHKNVATTGIYMHALTQERNAYAERVSAFLGLEEDNEEYAR